ncbi:hypothetical protein BJ170DRAFT_150916 [Xylariales sp. AK1849]|nr:hypothetical protein BJ170DRAFT_150916 [Xylariales sp. AK1849]
METIGEDLDPKYPVSVDQAGLEVAPLQSRGHARSETYTKAASTYLSDVQSIKQTDWEESPRKGILGLRVPVFWAVCVLSIVVLAGGTGGGIAAGIMTQNSATDTSSPASSLSSPPITKTTSSNAQTSSGTTSAPTGRVSPAPTDNCPSINNQTLTPINAAGDPISIASGAQPQMFVAQCNTNYPSGKQFDNADLHDILKMWTADRDACMEACAAYNAGYKAGLDSGRSGGNGFCRAVTIVKQVGEFCYLKNGTASNITTSGSPEIFSSAVLLTDVE